MNDSRDFKKEYDAFLQKVPYQTAVIDGIKVRYQYGGMDGAPVILFFKQRCTRGYKRYKETSGLIEWKECQIFHSIFT